VLQLVVRTAAGALLLLMGAVAASERSSAQPYVTKQTTTLDFSFTEKGHRALSKGRELSRASGSGTLTIPVDTPQARTVYKGTSATGVIKFHRWRVVANRVIDEDQLTMDVVVSPSGQSTYRFISRIANIVLLVNVTASDPKETDPCPVGSTGVIGVSKGKVKTQPDSFSTEICGFHFLYGGNVGLPARVKVTITQTTP
jgi:hypothetical protein